MTDTHAAISVAARPNGAGYKALALLYVMLVPHPAWVMAQERPKASIEGRVLDGENQRALGAATITLESSSISARSDGSGHYVLIGVPPGPQVLLARRVGYAPARVRVMVPYGGTLAQDIVMAEVALKMREVSVTADPISRARGELGTASVIPRDAIVNQSAPSLAGVLELIPGAVLQPPGLDDVQQFGIRSVPTTTGAAERLAAFGTLIVLDGVPLSNNTNLQTTGPRGEIVPLTSAGGGIDIRRIPAAAIERVEVIRGVPSARYGDLTAGAIVIDTRAGLVTAEGLARYDPRTTEANLAGGRGGSCDAKQAAVNGDVARTLKAPGVTDAVVWRATLDGGFRASLGRPAHGDACAGRIVLDTRLNAYQVYSNQPEQPDIHPGVVSSDRSAGIRVSERATVGSRDGKHVELTAAVDHGWQDTRSQRLLLREPNHLPIASPSDGASAIMLLDSIRRRCGSRVSHGSCSGELRARKSIEYLVATTRCLSALSCDVNGMQARDISSRSNTHLRHRSTA